MAIAFVNGTTAQVSGQSLSKAYSATAGNIVVVCLTSLTGASGWSIKDANNVPLTAGPTVTNSATGMLFYYTVPVGGDGGSFQASWTGAVATSMWIGEYSGAVGGVNPIGATNSGATTPVTVSLVSTRGNSFVVGALSDLSGNVFPALSGNQRELINTGGPRGMLVDNTAVSSGSTITISATQASNQAWCAVAVELLASLPPSVPLSKMGPTPRGFNGTPWQHR